MNRLGADGYLPKRRPPLLAAYDLGQPDVVKMRREARHIYSPPNDDDYSALPGRVSSLMSIYHSLIKATSAEMVNSVRAFSPANSRTHARHVPRR